MRVWIVIFALLAATPAMAGRTCFTPKGDMIRCNAPGAMPVFWKPSAQVMWEREMTPPPGPRSEQLLAAFGWVVLLLALIALLPDFDGWQADSENEDGGK